MKEIVIASKNAGKVAEIKAAFADLPVSVVSLADLGVVPDAVEDGATFLDNALIKARFYAKLTGKACLADDSGLEVDALGGAPGVRSARYAGESATDAENNAKLLRALAQVARGRRCARFRCALAFVDAGGEALTADGCCEGEILAAPAGDGGFGYDPLFHIKALDRSMGQITREEKNQISHRGAALREMAGKLAGYLK